MDYRRAFLAVTAVGVSACTALPVRPVVVPPVQPPVVAVDRTPEYRETCTNLYQSELGHPPSDGQLAECVAVAVAGETGDQIKADLDKTPEHAAYIAPKPRPTRDRVLAIRGDIGGYLWRGQRSWDIANVCRSDAERVEFLAWKQAQGFTHVWVQATGSDYPGLDPHCYLDPATVAARVHEVLDHGLVPILELSTGSGGSYPNEFVPRFAAIAAALRGEELYIVWVPGFEVVGPEGGWTSFQLSQALCTMHDTLGNVVIGVHLQPERASGASYGGSGPEQDTPAGYVWHDYQDPKAPGLGAFIEADDPWRGDEVGFWKSHCGEFATILIYQSTHDDHGKLLNPCYDRGANGDCVGGWEDRFNEILDRLGAGYAGWRIVNICFCEVTLYDQINDRGTDDDKQRINDRAVILCDIYGVECAFGNGLPRVH